MDRCPDSRSTLSAIGIERGLAWLLGGTNPVADEMPFLITHNPQPGPAASRGRGPPGSAGFQPAGGRRSAMVQRCPRSQERCGPNVSFVRNQEPPWTEVMGAPRTGRPHRGSATSEPRRTPRPHLHDTDPVLWTPAILRVPNPPCRMPVPYGARLCPVPSTSSTRSACYMTAAGRNPTKLVENRIERRKPGWNSLQRAKGYCLQFTSSAASPSMKPTP